MRYSLYHCSTVLALLTTLGGCGGSDGIGPETIPAEAHRIIATTNARPFQDNSPYANLLQRCAVSDNTPCLLAELPYIGWQNSQPTVDDIMQRTLVTHDWMGVRFAQLLHAMPADMLPLFGSLTAIRIGSEIRPSSYNAEFSQLQIDPRYLWIGVDEKRTISQADDYRDDFGANLNFITLRRLMLGDDYAIPFSSLEDDNERPFSELQLNFARLMYHELAHANDFISATSIPDIDLNQTPAQAAEALQSQSIATQLYADQFLTITESPLFGIAAVRFRDAPATDEQIALSGESVGSLFSNEGKSLLYAYSNRQEDVATLFEIAMVKRHYNVDLHIGFANKNGEPNCNTRVSWGVRNRLAAPLVRPRSRWVTQQILGESAELETFFEQSVGEQTSLAAGVGWCQSRFSSTAQAKAHTLIDSTDPADESVLNEHAQRVSRHH